MDLTRLNPLVYTDIHPFDDFEPDGTTEAVAETVALQRYLLQRAARQKAAAKEWERIKRHLFSPKQREIAMTRMAETPHDFNLILYDDAAFPSASEEDEDESDARGRLETVLAPYVKPGMINVAIEKESLKDVSGGGITLGKKGEAKLVRSARESIYTAHTILHRIGDDRTPRLAPNRRWWGWKKFTPEYMKAYAGKPYAEALTEATMRAAGLYLSEPGRDSLFLGTRKQFRRGNEGQRTLVTAAEDRIGRALSLPVALLATDPKIVKAFVRSNRKRFKKLFGVRVSTVGERLAKARAALAAGDRVAAKRILAEALEETEGLAEQQVDWEEQCQQLTRDVAGVLANIREALIYGSGTTWISRQGLASDVSQVIAETMPQTEMYSGTKFLVPDAIGRVGPSDSIVRTTHFTSGNKDVPIPPDLREEVQAAMRPVELAFDAYNNAVLDSPVGRVTRI